MSDNTKLDPATLSAEERALWDTLAIRKLATGTLPENAYARSEGALIDLLKVRRALFGTATEKAKCVLHEEIVRDGPSKWTCETHPEPATQVNGGYQPIDRGESKSPPQGGTGTIRPAAPVHRVTEQGRVEVNKAALFASPAVQEVYEIAGRIVDHGKPEPAALVNGHTPIGEYDPDMKPAAQGEMPCPFCGAAPEVTRPSGRSEWIPESAGLGSAGWSGPVTEASCRACGVMRVPLVIWNSRTHSQPVDDEDLQFHINRAEYWIKERVLLGDQKETVLALKVAACKKQPVAVAVGMTEELALVLDAADEVHRESTYLGRHEKAFSLGAAISNLRQQAALGKPKVELPKVREFIDFILAYREKYQLQVPFSSLEMTMFKLADTALSELDAAEGRK